MPALNTKQVHYLRNKRACVLNLTQSRQLSEFFDLFLVCEVTARKLIEYHKQAQTPQLKIANNNNYTWPQVRAAARYFGLIIPPNVGENIFEANRGLFGRKSCKQLRNKYLHNVPNGMVEIGSRFTALRSDMEQWINLFV